MRIVFMGNGPFGCLTLQALAEDPKIDMIAVYTHPPKPIGRGHKVSAGPIQTLAERLSLPVLTPSSLNKEEEVTRLQTMKPDVIVVASYGLILPPCILEIPRQGCINLHASLLPRWRGASPIQQAILAGDVYSGLSIMHMEAGLDTGPTYAMFPIALNHDETTGTLHDRLASLAADCFPALLHQISHIQPKPQLQEGVHYAPKILRENAQLAWDQSASVLERCIRAFHPAPKAWTTWQGHILKIGKAQIIDTECHTSCPGTILHHPLKVACGQGTTLQILELQKADGRMIDAAAFLRGHPIPISSCLGT